MVSLNGGYKVSPGIRQAVKLPLTHGQLAHREPWIVMVLVDGTRRGKPCSTLGHAIQEHRRYRDRYPNATIVSRSRAYDIPPELRGKLPKGWKWCPFCMKPRKYRRIYTERGTPETFYANVKVWSKAKQRYEFKERELAVMECPMCLNTNQHSAFRRSNQPWETRRIKKGARRIKRRHRTRRRGKLKL